MAKKVVFQFDENSKVSLDELREQGYTFTEIALKDGRHIIFPTPPHLTQRALDGGDASAKWRHMANALAQMLLDAASKGYVSSNDLDYANESLDEIHRWEDTRRK